MVGAGVAGIAALSMLASCGDGDTDRLAIPGATVVTAPTTDDVLAAPDTDDEPMSGTAGSDTETADPASGPTPEADDTPAADSDSDNADTAPASAPDTMSAPAPDSTPPAPPTTTSPVVATVPIVYLRAGDEGPGVTAIQEQLIRLEYLAPGGATGVFDRATNSAVLAFQGQYGLIVDGVVGPETRSSLAAASASVATDAPSTD